MKLFYKLKGGHMAIAIAESPFKWGLARHD
jgi:hypothetical protein